MVAGVGDAARVEALRGLGLLDTSPEERFDRVTRVASAYFDVPIALVSLVDANRQWAKSCIGMVDRESPRSTSFCSVAIASDAPLIVEDATADARFSSWANVVDDPHIRFYAGVPVRTRHGHAVGTLCIADRRPRTLDDRGLGVLHDLARVVEDELERTDLAAALAAQRESEQHVRAVMDNVAEGIITFGDDGVIRSANPAAVRAFGALAGGLVGRQIASLIEDATWEGVRRWLPAQLGHRRVVTGRRVDGTTFPLELIVTAAQVNGERMLIGIGQDVTQRLEAQAALRESEQRFRAVFDGAALGMLVIDRDATITDANPAMGELLGLPLDELCGMPARKLIDPGADMTLFDELFRGVRATYKREQRLIRSDGRDVWVAATVSATHDAEGRTLNAVAMVEDITERKEMERLKDEFVSVVGHELRTPLTSIRGSLGLLAGGVVGELGEEAREMVRMALDNTNRLVRLVDDTLDLERMQAGAGQIDLRTVDVRPLVEAAVDVVERLAVEARVEISTDVEDLEVLADPDRIVQALTNLIGNAIKFSPEGGTIHVTARTQGAEAELSVADEGRGIPAEQLDAIFERFRQVDASDRREKGGTGLGLAIAREIVKACGGRIWAESEHGQGATFRFTLPLAAQAVTIAVCDRRGEVRDSLAARLGGMGLRALPVAGVEALAEVAGRERVAAVVLLLGPATAALVAALEDHEATARIPKVLLERPDEQDLLGALEAGVPELRAGRVLIVEDDQDLGRVLVRGIERRGFDVELARTGREAREAIERAVPGLVVLDLTLPGEDGFAVVDWLRRTDRLAAAPLLVYSGRAIRDEDRRRLQLGQTEFLEKGTTEPADVERRVAELLGCMARVGH